MQNTKGLRTVGTSLLILVSTAACSQQAFKLVNPKQKREFLSNNWVFNNKVRLAASDSTGLITATPATETNTTDATTSSTTIAAGGSSSNSNDSGQMNSSPGSGSSSSDATASTNSETDSESSPGQGSVVSSSPATIAGSVGVQYICGNRLTTNAGGINLLHSDKSASFTVRLVEVTTNKVLCGRSGADIKEALLNQKKLLLPIDCPDLSASKFNLQVYAGDAPALMPQQPSKTHDQAVATFFGAMGVTGSQQGQLLYNNREMPITNITSDFLQSTPPSQVKASKGTDLNGLFNLFNAASQNGQFYVLYDERDSKEACDLRSASPLFINMGSNGNQTELSPISEGVMFDILGKNAKPVAHAKKRISWFVDPNYMFIVKPNRNGQVLGVDEMFGNNTQGPDGKMAADGFHALAKYDANRDTIIDADDEVFNQLRLWSDTNLDGIAEPGELFYLDFMGIEAIDLNFNPKYYELDKYGNEIKYKSVVKMKDQSLKLVFDLWFRYL